MAASVSIIIPCHLRNATDTALLAETLGSVATQSCNDYELIVVDDGSPWSAVAATSGHRATLIRQDQAGPAMARNTGIAASRGDYIIFLDADDLLLPHAVRAGLGAFAAHPECGLVVGPREEMTYEGQPVPWAVPPPPVQQHLYLPLLGFEWYIIPPSCAMFRRRSVEAVGGFRDPWGADDLDFYLRVVHRFDAHCYQSPAVTRYRRYSTSSSRDGERMLRSVRIVYERQREIVAGDLSAEAAFAQGLSRLTEIFRDCLVENIRDRLERGETDRALHGMEVLAIESPERRQSLIREPAMARLWESLTGTGEATELQETRATR